MYLKKSSSSWVLKLVIINALVFFLQNFIVLYSKPLFFYLGLTTADIVEKGFLWQFFSYSFLHANFLHIFFNMYALFLFGFAIERVWGSKKFLFYYFFTAIGAGITIFLINVFFPSASYYIPTIGASGAVYGLLLAFGLLFPEMELLIFFFLPMKAKYVVFLYGALEFYFLLFGGSYTNISHSGHLGGILFGFIFFFLDQKSSKKRKKLKTKVIKKRTEGKRKKEALNEKEGLIELYKKIKDTSLDDLSDDDYQKIKYYQIWYDDLDKKKECLEEKFDTFNKKCLNCPSFEICLIDKLLEKNKEEKKN